MKIPHLDSNYRDHYRGNIHCGHCKELIDRKGVVVKPYALITWDHTAPIFYPEIKATSEKGHTLEDQVERPAQWLLARIPLKTHVCYCLEHFNPFVACMGVIGCTKCGKTLLDKEACSSFVVLGRYPDGTPPAQRVLGVLQGFVHINCLPEEFDEVKDYIDRHG